MTQRVLSLFFVFLLFVPGARAWAETPTLEQAALAAMLRLSPPERHRPPPGWAETPEAARVRYASIARDIAAVARNRTEARWLVGVAWHESGFAADVDAGDCSQEKGFRGRCDGGRAASLWQLQGGDVALYKRDRRAAAKEALVRMYRSRRACSANAEDEKLAAYAGGVCNLLTTRAAARSLAGAIARTARAGL